MDILVSTQWLSGVLDADGLRILDATWFLPGTDRNARDEFEAAHIPGAAFFDLDGVSETEAPVAGKLPPDHKFASRMRALGIGDGDRIVVYDNSPLRTAARAWFLLKAYGVREVAVLDGGLEKWKAEGRPLETGPAAPGQGHFTAALERERVVDKGEMMALLGASGRQIVDARGPARFAGEEPEPRPGMAAGHIPGARNVPYSSLYNPDGTFKRGEALRAAFEGAGVDPSRPIVATCGSGVTASALVFAAQLLGNEDVRLYDGSWAEWGADPATPKATGRA
ncbi:MAG TPA: 3-mercaptopyruvate sulfurtransferase [Allosphingosinicella sp.]